MGRPVSAHVHINCRNHLFKAEQLIVFSDVLCVPVVLGQNSYGVTYTSTQMCAVEGSTVEISCSYTYPSRIKENVTVVEKAVWFTKMEGGEAVDLMTDAEFSGRVQYHCDENKCTLRISDLRERDSAEYKFRFITNQPGGKYTGLPGVTLTVSGKNFSSRYVKCQTCTCCYWTIDECLYLMGDNS